MIHKTLTVVGALVVLALLTGCGGAMEVSNAQAAWGWMPEMDFCEESWHQSDGVFWAHEGDYRVFTLNSSGNDNGQICVDAEDIVDYFADKGIHAYWTWIDWWHNPVKHKVQYFTGDRRAFTTDIPHVCFEMNCFLRLHVGRDWSDAELLLMDRQMY